LFLAKEGGYYQQYGLDARLVFTVHPAEIAMLVSGEAQLATYSLEQMMQAASRDGSLIFIGSPLNKGMFVIVARSDVRSVKDLRGRRIGVSQLGDAPYSYSLALIRKFGISARDVKWIPLGTDVNGRVAALVAGRIDATLVTAPAYFKLESAGFRILANFADVPDILSSTAMVMKRKTLEADPQLAIRLLKAQAEAVKRFYIDRGFAIKAYLAYDKNAQEPDVERLYDLYARANAFERVPYVLSEAVRSTISQQTDPQIAANMKAFDFHKIVDNRLITSLVSSGFYEHIFGNEIEGEEHQRAQLAFQK